MHLLYQSFSQQEGSLPYSEALRRLLDGAASPQTTLTIGHIPAALMSGKGSGVVEALDLPALLKSVARHVAGGVSGIAIGNGFDPGLLEARELFDVPVLGWFETLTAYALRSAWRVGVLCSGASGPARIEAIAAVYGIQKRLVRPRSLGSNLPAILAAFGDAEAAEAIVAASERAAAGLAQDGAEAVIVASGMLDVLLETVGTKSLAGLPLIPGVPVLVKELEAAASLAALGVPFVSRVGRFRSPPREVFAALADEGGEP